MHFTKGFTSVYRARWRRPCKHAMKLRGIIKKYIPVHWRNRGKGTVSKKIIKRAIKYPNTGWSRHQDIAAPASWFSCCRQVRMVCKSRWGHCILQGMAGRSEALPTEPTLSWSLPVDLPCVQRRDPGYMTSSFYD